MTAVPGPGLPSRLNLSPLSLGKGNRMNPILYANGFGVWHAAVAPGPDAEKRAADAIRGELLDRGDIEPFSPYRVRVELAPDWAQGQFDGRAVYREADSA